MRRFFGLDGGKTFKPVKRHKPGTKRAQMHACTIKTLGSGNLTDAVSLPAGEDLDEWLALNTVDFFNELSLLYGVVVDDAAKFNQIGEGFPPGFEYRWADGIEVKTPIKCSSPEYVDYVMSWADSQLSNEVIFPTQNTTPFPKKFLSYVKNIFKRLYRIFAIIYSNHVETIRSLGAEAHLNTSFKHFLFFVLEFDLVNEKEFAACPNPTQRFKEEYIKLKNESKERK